MTPAPVVIAGGGIAGLAAAIGLHRAGVPVTVVERSAAPASGGALGIQSNAVLALRWLELATPVVDAGIPVEDYALLSWRGGELARWSPGAVGRELGAPSVTVPRAVLSRTLRAALPAGCLVTGTVLGYRESSDAVEVRLADGTRLDAVLLVGADGLHSVIRRELLKDQEPARHAGYTSWRGTSPITTDSLRHGTAAHLFGTGRTFGMWPLPGGRTYWVATQGAGPDRSGTVTLDATQHGELVRAFADAPSPVLDLIASTDGDGILRTPIYDRDPVARWHSPRVVLIGDAAHPMQPTTGQGAAQALLDAVALCVELGTLDWPTPGSLVAALDRFVATRQGATARAVQEAREIGKLQHVGNPVAAFVRNTVMRATPGAVWQRRAAARVDEIALIQRAYGTRTALPEQPS